MLISLPCERSVSKSSILTEGLCSYSIKLHCRDFSFHVSFVKKTVDAPISFIKYYLDKTLPPEANGKNPPLIIPYNAMINFVKATSTDSEHVRIVTAEQCHYKSGDKVRVIAGDFKGVVGKVARIAGQQRIVVEISGLCLVATAYIPTDFIEIVK